MLKGNNRCRLGKENRYCGTGTGVSYCAYVAFVLYRIYDSDNACCRRTLFGLVWLLTGMSYEYEYILTNDDLDIDKITGKRKRKRLITLKMNTVEEFGIYDGSNGTNADATVIASDGTNINAYYLIAKHKTHGRTMLIFSPDARMVEMILTTLPYKVKQEATQRINAIKADSEKE